MNFSMKKGAILIGTLFIFLAACATYQTKVSPARAQLEKRQAQAAAETLKPLAEKEGRDQLVYLFDYGTALQQAGDFTESNRIWQLADKLADYKDYVSLSKQTASLLFSQEMVQYKGDPFEKIIVNAMLAINYLMMNDLEGAFVETRRLNEKLEYFRIEGKKKYDQNAFARYIGAIIREANREVDGAFIDYKKTYELNPHIPYLKEDLVRSAYDSRNMDDYKNYAAEFGIQYRDDWRKKNFGELILVFQQGWGPVKRPRPEAPRFPGLYPVRSETASANLVVEGFETERTQEIYSIESVAIKTLDDDYSALVAKRVAGVVAKEVAADQIRQKNEALGAIAQIVMHASDRADVRQWSTLPETFQIARIRLPEGRHRVQVQGLNRQALVTGEQSEWMDVEIKARKKTFIGWRAFY